jgi:KDO2-lipid IV(A) lauroyltransferase
MYTLLKIISWKFQILPRKLALFFGRMLGSFFYYFIPLRKSIAMKNLEIAFPNWDSNKKKSLLHSCYCHYGMVLADFFRLPKVKREKDKIIVNIPFESIELLKQYSGGIILSGHIGNWEYIGPSLGLHNIKCAGVAQIQHNSTSDQFFNELRRSENVQTISVDGGSKLMMQIIRDGNYLGLISDQSAGRRGTEAQFFNSPVSVPKGAGAFHLKTNTPILVGFCILSKDFTYHLSFEELDVERLSDNSNEAIVEINRRYSKLLEETVREYPKQYFWFHRKWARENYKGLSRF